MMRHLFVGAALCASASLSLADTHTTAPYSQAIGVHNGPLTVNNSVNSPPQPNNVSVVLRAPDTSKLNVLQQHQDALLLAENPTKIKIVDAKFMRWMGDDEEYLSLVFRNVSKLPANKFDFGNIDPKSVGKNIKNLKFLKFTPSASEFKNVKFDYQIEAGTDHIAPFISMSELRKVLNVRPEYCIVLARIPEMATNFPPLPQKPGSSQGWDLYLPVAFTYWSIFGQQAIANSGISILVTQRDMLIPPGPNHKDSDIQCHDGKFGSSN